MSHLEAIEGQNNPSLELKPSTKKQPPALRLVKGGKDLVIDSEEAIREAAKSLRRDSSLTAEDRWAKAFDVPPETVYTLKQRREVRDPGVKSMTRDTGSSAGWLMGDHEHGRMSITESSEEGIARVDRENLAKFEGELQKVSDPSTRFSILQEMNGIKVKNLYKEFNPMSSKTGAGEKHSEILKVFHDEENELKQFKESGDPAIHAFIATRRLELAKMKMELEIKWLQKKMWDLEHNWWSPEKIALQNQVDVLEFDNLRPLLEKTILALKSERDLLIQQNGSPIGPQDWSPRLNYVVGRLIGLEDSLRDLDAAAGNRKPQ